VKIAETVMLKPSKFLSEETNTPLIALNAPFKSLLPYVKVAGLVLLGMALKRDSKPFAAPVVRGKWASLNS
jgi:hypothetical protein